MGLGVVTLKGVLAYKRSLITALCLVAIGVPAFLVNTRYQKWLKTVKDSMLVMDWPGFGPEKGLYNFTVVTALLDIGRGDWDNQQRKYSTYLLYMQRMLRLDVNMVVFVEPKGRPFIDWMRRGREARTRVVEIGVKDLPYYSYRDKFADIMASEQYRQNNELYSTSKAEAIIPEYDILQLSKFYFMDRAVRENPFNTSYYIWLDAGYAHGKDVHPEDGVWVPKNLFDHAHQLTFIERKPGALHYKPQRARLHKISINIIAGLFFAGGGEVIQEVYKLQQKQVDNWLEKGIVDDDQTMYMLLYYQAPALFNLVSGDWLDVFKLFNAHES
ncbi:protein htrl [Elysia marginata]|uniref:Protein htrl n=1 Tax=Elysia marginata TaxID=1093978 RepID=A0AAV4EJM7_9GAST|nr:protein htrl [Elysia marginata]